MTRSEVARALGRSIATVRRIEGVHLHPRKGLDGVHRFDPTEVRQLQVDVARRSVRLAPSWFNPHDEHQQNTCEALERDNQALRNLLRTTVDLARSLRRHGSRDDAAEELLDAAEEVVGD